MNKRNSCHCPMCDTTVEPATQIYPCFAERGATEFNVFIMGAYVRSVRSYSAGQDLIDAWRYAQARSPSKS